VVAKQTLLYIESANPQTLGLIPISQTANFLGVPVRKIADPKIFMINPQIENL
jgi:hypothetical protein